MANRFDRKFGKDFLKGLPTTSGVYRFWNVDGVVIYVGKAKNLRRRLSQYRLASSRRPHRKMKKLVGETEKITWEAHESELQALLRENALIQELRPQRNVAGRYCFLYPFIGIAEKAGEHWFCFTARPEALPEYRWFGAFRSREVVGAAFFGLMQLLPFLGHPLPRPKEKEKPVSKGRLYLFGFRRLSLSDAKAWSDFFEGRSDAVLESLSLALLEKPGARARATELQESFDALWEFWKHECLPLSQAILATGHATYPVSQCERDPLFLKFRATLGS